MGAAARALFPTDPAEIEHVVGLLIAEAADETFAAPSDLLRAWLAEELRRAPHFAELPETFSDAAYFAPGYWRDCAELYVWLGYLGQRNPERWQSGAERERERGSLLAAVTSIALQVRQYLAGEHVETVAAELPTLRETAAKALRARAGRSSKLPKARKQLAAEAKQRADSFEAEIRSRVNAGESWLGMPGEISRARGVPLSTAGDHVRRVRKLIESENNRR